MLNSDFTKTDLSFELADITRTINEDWFKNAAPYTQQQADMKGPFARVMPIPSIFTA